MTICNLIFKNHIAQIEVIDIALKVTCTGSPFQLIFYYWIINKHMFVVHYKP